MNDGGVAMSLVSRIGGAWNALFKATSQDFLGASLPPGAINWTRLSVANRSLEFRQCVERYQSWVYVCAGRNASAVAQTPLELFHLPNVATPASQYAARNYSFQGVLNSRLKELQVLPWLKAKQKANITDVEEVTEHPFLDLIAKVNPNENGFEMMEKLVLYLELCGNAFIFMAKNDLGVPVEIWSMMPHWTRIIPDDKEFIKQYEYGPITPKKILLKEDVVHFKYPNPKDMYLGWGPLQAAVDSVDTSNYYHRYEQTLLENYARPDFILSTDLPITTKQIDSIKLQWNKLFRGVRNQGKVAVLESGLKPVSFNFTPREMAFLQGRQISRDEIAAIFGVPKSLIETKDVNRSNSETGEYVYAKYTILPKLRRIEQKINEAIVWPYFGQEYFCAFVNPVSRDNKLRLEEITCHLTTGMTSINEERAVENMEPAAWGEGDPRPKAPAPAPAGGGSSNPNPNTQEPTNPVNASIIEAPAHRSLSSGSNGHRRVEVMEEEE